MPSHNKPVKGVVNNLTEKNYLQLIDNLTNRYTLTLEKKSKSNETDAFLSLNKKVKVPDNNTKLKNLKDKRVKKEFINDLGLNMTTEYEKAKRKGTCATNIFSSNSSNSLNLKNINTTTTNNNGNNISSKVYFRPQDLNSSNRLIQIQNEKSASIHNQDSFKQYNQNEVYIIPKNLNDRNNNNNNHSPIIVANNPLSSSSSSNPSNNKMVKKLSINVINEESKLNESPPNIIKENTSLPPTPIPVTRQCIEIKPMNTTTNKVIPATTK